MRSVVGKKIIFGCEARGDARSPYLTRYTLLSLPFVQVCLHIFHRSDADELHDHPWPFVSLILWRGYVEESAWKDSAVVEREGGDKFRGYVEMSSRYGLTCRKRVWPGMLLFRRAVHAHRVELVNGKPAATLVVMGAKQRTWGFFTRAGWQRWTDYFREKGC